MPNDNELKAWRDEAGHLLGWVRRNGSGVRQLMLLRQAIDMDSETPVEVDVLAIVEGGPVMEIRCSICDAVRSWYPDQEQLDRLVGRVLGLRRGVNVNK
jgi:hypothetical protein